MIKKLLIAVVAVVVGTMVLTKVTKISPMVWLGDCCRSARSMVPPEVQLKQLNKEIANIDKDIKKNIGRVAAMEEEVDNFEKRFKNQVARQSELKAGIVATRTSLEARSTQVAKTSASDLTRKLDRFTNEYVSLKETNKVHEKVLEQKKRTLEAAPDRLTKMQQEKDRLTLVSARLTAHLEALRTQQTSAPVAFDDSAIDRCHELANDIETRLNTADREAKLLKRYGYERTTNVLEEPKSREEVLKAAGKALEEDDDSVANKEEK